MISKFIHENILSLLKNEHQIFVEFRHDWWYQKPKKLNNFHHGLVFGFEETWNMRKNEETQTKKKPFILFFLKKLSFEKIDFSCSASGEFTFIFFNVSLFILCHSDLCDPNNLLCHQCETILKRTKIFCQLVAFLENARVKKKNRNRYKSKKTPKKRVSQ